jgi:hypothetical protein
MSVPTAIIIVFGEAHLRRILKCYAGYYNNFRMHRSLNKDAPVSRPVQRIGSIKSHAILGGLHRKTPELKFSVHTPTTLLSESLPALIVRRMFHARKPG